MPAYFWNPGRGINEVTDLMVRNNSLKCRQSNSSALVKYSWAFIGLKSLMVTTAHLTCPANNTRETTDEGLPRLTWNNHLTSRLFVYFEQIFWEWPRQVSDFSSSNEIRAFCSVCVCLLCGLFHAKGTERYVQTVRTLHHCNVLRVWL